MQFAIWVRHRGRLVSVRGLSKTPATKPPPNRPSESSTTQLDPGPLVTEAATSSKKRSFLKTFLVVAGMPVLAGGSAVAAYHYSDGFRQLADSNVPTDIIEDVKLRLHGWFRPEPDAAKIDNVAKDDFELARRPDVPAEDLEENPQLNGLPHLPPELLRSEIFRAYMHIIAQEKEDELREEFNSNLDDRIEERLSEQLDAKEKEMLSKCDAELIAKQKALDETFEADRRQRLERMDAIESQVRQVDAIIKNCEEKLVQSEKAHALAAAAVGLECALEGSGSSASDLANLERYAQDSTVSAVLSALPNKSSAVLVMTVDQIKNRFNTVARACRLAVLVPPDSGLFGHIIGRIFSVLLINRDSAIEEIESLNRESLAYSLASDWISEVKKRLAIQQGAAVLKLYAYELSHACIAAAAVNPKV